MAALRSYFSGHDRFSADCLAQQFLDDDLLEMRATPTATCLPMVEAAPTQDTFQRNGQTCRGRRPRLLSGPNRRTAAIFPLLRAASHLARISGHSFSLHGATRRADASLSVSPALFYLLPICRHAIKVAYTRLRRRHFASISSRLSASFSTALLA